MPRSGKSILIYVCTAPLLVTQVGCVSAARHQVKVDQVDTLERQISTLRKDLRAIEKVAAEENGLRRAAEEHNKQAIREVSELKQKLNSLEMTSRDALQARIRALEDALPRREELGYYKGMLELWQGIEFHGTPSSEGWFFKNYFYTVDFRIHGHSIYKLKFQTTEEAGEVIKIFSEILDIVSFHKGLKVLR